MKKLALFLPLALFLALTACSNDTQTGNGHLSTQTRPLTSFDKINISGKINALITVGRTDLKAKLVTDSNLINQIETRITDGTLYVGPMEGKQLYPSQPPALNLRVGVVQEITASGKVKIQIPNLKIDSFSVNTSGDSEVELRGEVQNLVINSTGKADINAAQVQAQNVTVNLRGSGNVTVNALQSLTVKIAGSGKVEYAGSPQINQSVTGSGKIQQLTNK